MSLALWTLLVKYSLWKKLGFYCKYSFFTFWTLLLPSDWICNWKNIKIVEAGAQGHHKIQRGYIAKPTYSNHFVLNDSFAKAIKNFTKLEEIEINKQIKFINTENSPYSNI